MHPNHLICSFTFSCFSVSLSVCPVLSSNSVSHPVSIPPCLSSSLYSSLSVFLSFSVSFCLFFYLCLFLDPFLFPASLPMCLLIYLCMLPLCLSDSCFPIRSLLPLARMWGGERSLAGGEARETDWGHIIKAYIMH